MPHSTLARVLVRFENTGGAALALAVDQANGCVNVYSGDLGAIDADAARPSSSASLTLSCPSAPATPERVGVRVGVRRVYTGNARGPEPATSA